MIVVWNFMVNLQVLTKWTFTASFEANLLRAGDFQLSREAQTHMCSVPGRDLSIKMREQTSNWNTMTRVGVWSGLEVQKCRGDPAAHRALYFIRKQLPTMVVTFATPSGPWLSSVLTQRESCCLHRCFLNRRKVSSASKNSLTGRAKESF